MISNNRIKKAHKYTQYNNLVSVDMLAPLNKKFGISCFIYKYHPIHFVTYDCA